MGIDGGSLQGHPDPVPGSDDVRRGLQLELEPVDVVGAQGGWPRSGKLGFGPQIARV